MPSRHLTLLQSIAWGALGVALFLGLWTFLSVSGVVPRQFLPSPLEVATRFLTLLSQPFAGATLPQHLASSFQRYAYGVVLAAVIGVPLGLMMGWFRLLDDIVTPVFDALRFIAPIAWVPFAALWFGTGIGGPVMIIFAGAFPPCLINAYRGARFVEPRYIEAARMLGTGNTRTILEVLLPALDALDHLRPARVRGSWLAVARRRGTHRRRCGGRVHDGPGAGQRGDVHRHGRMIAIGVVGMFIDVLLRQGEAWLRRRRGLEA